MAWIEIATGELVQKVPPVGTTVTDSVGNVGVVRCSVDPHNVWVDFNNDGGSGLYCIVPGCEEYDGLKW
jgi:hypothetical protein